MADAASLLARQGRVRLSRRGACECRVGRAQCASGGDGMRLGSVLHCRRAVATAAKTMDASVGNGVAAVKRAPAASDMLCPAAGEAEIPVATAPDSETSPPPTKIMPRARGLPFVGTTLALIAAGGARHLHHYIDSRHKELGPIFRERLGHVEGVFVAEADAMRKVFALEGRYPSHSLPDSWLLYNEIFGCKRGLFFMEGEEWLDTRRIMNKLLLRSNHMDLIISACDSVVTNLVEELKADSGSEITNLDGKLYLWSLEVIVSILLGSTYKKHRSELLPMLIHLSENMYKVFEHTSRLLLTPAKLAYYLGFSAWKDFVTAIDDALNTANNLVEELLPMRKEGEGLLSHMLEQDLNIKSVQRIVADLILAAGDTTVYTLQWLLYMLCENPEIQEEMFQQVQNISDAKDMSQLPLPRWCMRETLRLYPVAIFLTRHMPEDCQLSGYHVEAGTLVMISLFTSGRNPNYFPQPEKFWPHRWERNNEGRYVGVKSPYATIPFAMGSRSCIGRRIAEIQLTLTVAKLVKNFKFEALNTKPLELVLRMIAVPSEPLRLKPIRREDQLIK